MSMIKSPISDALEIERLFHDYGAHAGATHALRTTGETSAIRRVMESFECERTLMQSFSQDLAIQKMIESIEREKALMQSFSQDLAIQKMIESIEREKMLMRPFLGPLEDLRRAGMFDAASLLQHEIERTRLHLQDFEARFRLPELPDIARLIAEFQASPLSDALTPYSDHAFVIQRAIESAVERMRSPWLDVQNKLNSLASFAELQGIGHLVRSMAPFGEHLADTLRIGLGDWRDPITWKPEILSDLETRSSFYAGLGFNRALTTFPAPAFREGLDIAGLRRDPPRLVEQYGDPVPASCDDEQEEGFERTNAAHDQITRLETQVRAFIDAEMTRIYGADWPKHRLPNGLYDEWMEKKRKAQESGAREWPLISYADFTDYERVICRADNFRQVFAGYFGRSERVRESLQRLYPIRLEAMHARLITQDDELLLFVEIRRLMKLINKQ